jgi:hypothetical protein
MAACTNCRKAQRQCSYSRQPQKRGPSKGYIKELADRLKDVEQRLHTGNGTPKNLNQTLNALQELGGPHSGSIYANSGHPGEHDVNRKRTFSASGLPADLNEPHVGGKKTLRMI